MVRYKHDEGGAPAYDPAMLLQIMLFAYSQGSIHSRQIEQLGREHVVCMALSAATTPHVTTLAAFVASLSAEITTIFRNILLVCDEAGLIGREMFAVDGVKLSSHASKDWSGAKTDLHQKAQKRQAAVAHLGSTHCANDARDAKGSSREAAERQMNTLNAAIENIEGFLATHEDKLGPAGTPTQSHITDQESAKMPTSTGVIQGYSGVAIADRKPQVIVHAEAFGDGQEHGLLRPMLEGVRETCQALALSADIRKETQLTADAGYASEANAEYLVDQGIAAYIADTLLRKRDARLHSAQRHQPTREDAPFATPKRGLQFQPQDFQLAAEHSHVIGPAGQRMYKSGGHRDVQGLQTLPYRGTRGACAACLRRAQWLRDPDRSVVRQVALVVGRAVDKPAKDRDKMKRKIDSDVGRDAYSRRLGIIEPVLGNLRHTKRLTRFTLRGRRKVHTQWQRYWLVHNIEKLQRCGRLEERMNVRCRRAA